MKSWNQFLKEADWHNNDASINQYKRFSNKAKNVMANNSYPLERGSDEESEWLQHNKDMNDTKNFYPPHGVQKLDKSTMTQQQKQMYWDTKVDMAKDFLWQHINGLGKVYTDEDKDVEKIVKTILPAVHKFIDKVKINYYSKNDERERTGTRLHGI